MSLCKFSFIYYSDFEGGGGGGGFFIPTVITGRFQQALELEQVLEKSNSVSI